MSKSIYLFILLSLSLNLAKAQKAQYSLFGGINYAAPQSETLLQPTFITSVVDTNSITVIDAEQDLSFQFENKLGVNLGLSIQWPVHKILYLESGIELQYFQHQGMLRRGTVRPSLNGSSQTFFFNSGNTSGGLVCDEFINTGNASFDVFERDRIDHHIVYLKIPIQLNIGLMENRLLIKGGGYFATPVFSQVPRFQSSFESRTEMNADGTNRTICITDANIVDDNDGRYFKDAIFGWQTGLSYQFNRRLGLDFIYQRAFSASTIESFELQHGRIKVTNLSANIRFFFTRK